MMITFSELNLPAIGAAALAYSAFCGVWHRQFAFGKKWENAMGFSRPVHWKETAIYYVVPSLSCWITSFALFMLFDLVKVTTLSQAFYLGLLAGIGFGSAVTFTNAVIPTMKRPLVFGSITGSGHAIGIVIAALLIFLIPD